LIAHAKTSPAPVSEDGDDNMKNAILAGALLALSAGAAEERILTKAEAGKVAVADCYRQCFDTLATVDSAPILRVDAGNTSTDYASWHGLRRCTFAVRAHYVVEQCAVGCKDVERAYAWAGTSAVRTRYLAAVAARKRYLTAVRLLPIPPTYAEFDRNCYESANDGIVFHDLSIETVWSDPRLRTPTASKDASAAHAPSVAKED